MSVNIISLNQIIDLFKDFADRHYFINDFGYGPTSDIGTTRQMEMPYMWVTTSQNSVIRATNKTAIPDLSFTVLFMDKTNIQENYLEENGVNSNNVQEILSDMLQCLQDFITEIQVNFGNYGIMLLDDINCYPAVDETQDSVNGWVGEFTIRTKHSNCILPTGDIVQTNLSPINPTTRYLTCDTVTACTQLQQYIQQQAGTIEMYQVTQLLVPYTYITINHNLNNRFPQIEAWYEEGYPGSDNWYKTPPTKTQKGIHNFQLNSFDVDLTLLNVGYTTNFQFTVIG